jgi:hypothetical protein
MGRRTAGPYNDKSEAVCSYDALRLGLDAFGILVRGPSRLGKRGRGRQHRSSSAARPGMPTSKGKRSGCALRTVCARRSAWLCCFIRAASYGCCLLIL